MNKDNRRTEDDITGILYVSNKPRSLSTRGSLGESKIQISRSHSPTLERLAAARNKLGKYITSTSDITSVNQQLTHIVHEASYSSDHEQQSTTNEHISSSLPKKRVKSEKNLAIQPLDKITYEETREDNGNLKQKCSVEIWLPNVCTDTDDGNTSQMMSRDSTTIEKIFESIPIKSRTSSANRVSTITANNERKLSNEISSKKPKSSIISYVQHYEDMPIDRLEKRSRSSKTNSTLKSNDHECNKDVKRPYIRCLSSSTKNSIQSALPGLSMTSKSVFPNINQIDHHEKTKRTFSYSTSTAVNNSEKKSSKRKINHKLIQTKQQRNKTRHYLKYDLHITKALRSSNHPKVAFKIVLSNTSPRQSGNERDIINARLHNHHSSNHKSSHSDMSSQSHVISMIENYRTATSKLRTPLSVITTKKTDDLYRSLQIRIPSRLTTRSDSQEDMSSLSNCVPSTITDSEHISKRSLLSSLLILRSEQQQTTQHLPVSIKYQNSAHTSTTDVSKTKDLVHLKYSKSKTTSCNYLLPK